MKLCSCGARSGAALELGESWSPAYNCHFVVMIHAKMKIILSRTTNIHYLKWIWRQLPPLSGHWHVNDNDDDDNALACTVTVKNIFWLGSLITIICSVSDLGYDSCFILTVLSIFSLSAPVWSWLILILMTSIRLHLTWVNQLSASISCSQTQFPDLIQLKYFQYLIRQREGGLWWLSSLIRF